jgi:hypothetical protein
MEKTLSILQVFYKQEDHFAKEIIIFFETTFEI